MTFANAELTSQLELQCTHHTVIIRNASLENNFPGGTGAFLTRYRADANEHITVHCVTDPLLGGIVGALELMGLEQSRDFVVIDTVECEMWRMIHSDEIEQPFWFETGADWLRYRHWKGRVLVWYDG